MVITSSFATTCVMPTFCSAGNLLDLPYTNALECVWQQQQCAGRADQEGAGRGQCVVSDASAEKEVRDEEDPARCEDSLLELLRDGPMHGVALWAEVSVSPRPAERCQRMILRMRASAGVENSRRARRWRPCGRRAGRRGPGADRASWCRCGRGRAPPRCGR